MSGGACVIIIAESLKLKPSSQLEMCLRATCANPLVVERLGGKSYIWQLGTKLHWTDADQRKVQATLRKIVETDMSHIKLPPAP